MKRFVIFLFMMLLVGCASPGDPNPTPVPFGQAPARAATATIASPDGATPPSQEGTPSSEEQSPEGTNTPEGINTPEAINTPEGTNTPEAINTPEATNTPEGSLPPATETPVAEEDPSNVARFTGLRFASTPDGPPQSSFANGTQQIYAIWDYEGMQSSDTMKRVWYLNEGLFIERVEPWDLAKYGSSGTVRDISMYDFIESIDAGQWRVELYINGESQIVGTFTVEGS